MVDPEVLAESVFMSLQWVEKYAAEWDFDEAAEFVAGLTELAKQYGQRLREFLAQAKAAGYSPEEIVQFVTELAQQVTDESPAKEALEKVLDSVKELLEEASEYPEEGMEEDHGKGRGDEDHGPAYEENKKQGDDENGNGSDEDQDEGSKGKGNGQGKADDDDDDGEEHNGKGEDHNEEDHGNHGHKGGDKD
ncbi:hypothetical protein ACVNPS_08690 [Candidatus Bipolaricaulota sp. J31]